MLRDASGILSNQDAYFYLSKISSAFSRDESHENKVTQAEEKFGHITDVSDVKYDEYEP